MERLLLTLLSAFTWATLKHDLPATNHVPSQDLYVAYMTCSLLSMHVAVASLGTAAYAMYQRAVRGTDQSLRFHSTLVLAAFAMWTLNHFLFAVTQFYREPNGVFVPTESTVRTITTTHVVVHIVLVWVMLPLHMLATSCVSVCMPSICRSVCSIDITT